MWLEQPDVLPDAYFIAGLDGRYVGVCDLNLRGAAPGELTQGFTGVRKEVRRQGIGTALTLAAIAYARAHGYSALRTFNRPHQHAIMALNEAIGFRRRISSVTLEKCLKTIAAVDPRVYDAYVGDYATDASPVARSLGRAFLITKEHDRLFAEFSGQKVELFPESDATFFVKWFYGRAEFRSDGRLLWTERNRSNEETTVCAAKTSSGFAKVSPSS